MKKVIVLPGAKGIKFGFGERNVEISDTMTVADAEAIQSQYPGIYVRVVDEVAKTDQVKLSKPAETPAKAETAKQ